LNLVLCGGNNQGKAEPRQPKIDERTGNVYENKGAQQEKAEGCLSEPEAAVPQGLKSLCENLI